MAKRTKGTEAAESFYKRLTRLFQSGPAIRRKIKGQNFKNYYDNKIMQTVAPGGISSASAFKREASAITGPGNSAHGAYGIIDRVSRYAEFGEMENNSEISAALNVYADEATATDENGHTFHVHSDNIQIQKALEELYFDVLNIEFNARRMVRNLVKNGDYVCFVEVVPQYGVINVEPLPVNEVEREEGFDKEDPYATRFKLLAHGNTNLENWQILHFRILGNDSFLPYGSSLLDAARRPFRQLTMAEDSMLVYRLVRSPERRVFYVDVTAVHPNDVPSYMEAVKEAMRGTSVIDQANGKQDFRYNPLPVWKNTPVPLIDGRSLTIEQLAKEFETGKENWVYSVEDKSLKIVPGKVVWCGKNYTATNMTKVTLDDGTWFLTAPEHPFVLRDGSSLPASQLTCGLPLMPVALGLSERTKVMHAGYRTVVDPGSGIVQYMHRVVANEVLSRQKIAAWEATDWSANRNLVTHHVDSNRVNSHPDNLVWMGNVDHIKYHSTKGAEGLLRYNKTQLHRTRTIERNRRLGLGKKLAALYNGTELHKSHNINRKRAQEDSWALNKELRSKNMRFIIPQACLDLVHKFLAENKETTRDRLFPALIKNKEFKKALIDANLQIKRKVHKMNPRVFVSCVNRATGTHGFEGLKQYANHRVATVESVQITDDVFCMTVVGPNGEEDRHNFAAVGFPAFSDCDWVAADGNLQTWLSTTDQSKTTAIAVKNSIEDDIFLPTRPNNQTKIENLAGAANATAMEDVEYLQKKLIAALMVPRAYLTFDDAISCLVGETKIPLLDGTSPTVKELADKFATGEFSREGSVSPWCYSTLLDGTVVPGRITKAWETKKATTTYKVHLDNGTFVECTANHPFLLRDGVYRRADELTAGDSLMPVYRKLSDKATKASSVSLDGYEMVLNNQTGNWEYTHKVVNEFVANHADGYSLGHTVGRTRVVHHKDFNKLNNHPDNLQKMTWAEHHKFHSEHAQTTILRPDVVARREPARIARKLKSVQMSVQMADKNSKLREWVHSDKNKQTISTNLKSAWSTESYRSLKTTQNKEVVSRPEVREKLFGKNHWNFNGSVSLEWLVDYCKTNNVTKYAHFRNTKQQSRCSTVIVDRLLSEAGFVGKNRWHRFREAHGLGLAPRNHKVVWVEAVDHHNESEYPSVFDLEVEHHHNFLVEQGVIVHNSKSTLAQEDIRFSRTVATIQKIMVAELMKLGIVHLYALGFVGEDLLNFELKFSNPSSVAVQQKLALIASKLEIAGKALEIAKETGILSIPYIQKEILGLRPEEINVMRAEAKQDQIDMAELRLIGENPKFDTSVDSNIDLFDKSNYKVPSSPFAKDNSANDKGDGVQGQGGDTKNDPSQAERQRDSGIEPSTVPTSTSGPVKVNLSPLSTKLRRTGARAMVGNRAMSLPDFHNMLSPTKNRYSRDPWFGARGGLGTTVGATRRTTPFILESEDPETLIAEDLGLSPQVRWDQPGIPKELRGALRRMHQTFHWQLKERLEREQTETPIKEPTSLQLDETTDGLGELGGTTTEEPDKSEQLLLLEFDRGVVDSDSKTTTNVALSELLKDVDDGSA